MIPSTDRHKDGRTKLKPVYSPFHYVEVEGMITAKSTDSLVWTDSSIGIGECQRAVSIASIEISCDQWNA